MRDVFITGTDTGVGKTIVTAVVLSLARGRKIEAAPMKPVQTGCLRSEGKTVATDLEFCLEACGMRVPEEVRNLMVCYRFELPCSPHLAASMAGTQISVDNITRSFGELKKRYEAIVVEGAGGVLAPISAGHTMLDIMKALGLPVVLVARPGLGTLNHTLLSCRELSRAGLEVAGVVLNHVTREAADYIEQDNVRAIKEFTGVPVIGNLPHVSEIESLAASPGDFRGWAQTHMGGWEGRLNG